MCTDSIWILDGMCILWIFMNHTLPNWSKLFAKYSAQDLAPHLMRQSEQARSKNTFHTVQAACQDPTTEPGLQVRIWQFCQNPSSSGEMKGAIGSGTNVGGFQIYSLLKLRSRWIFLGSTLQHFTSNQWLRFQNGAGECEPWWTMTSQTSGSWMQCYRTLQELQHFGAQFMAATCSQSRL